MITKSESVDGKRYEKYIGNEGIALVYKRY